MDFHTCGADAGNIIPRGLFGSTRFEKILNTTLLGMLTYWRPLRIQVGLLFVGAHSSVLFGFGFPVFTLGGQIAHGRD